MTQTIGQRLKAEREERRLTLEKVFEATRIRVQYLQALEADDLSVMSSPVQARGYLRNYAEYLGFDVDQMLGEMRAMSTQPTSGEVIGPADSALSIPQPDNHALETQPVVPIPEVPAPVEHKPTSLEEPDSSSNVTVPIKPKPFDRTQGKPARRKKADSQLQPSNGATQDRSASAEAPTKRRGRKKIEAESLPVVESVNESAGEVTPPAEILPQPNLQAPIEESTDSAEVVSQPEPSPELVSNADQAFAGRSEVVAEGVTHFEQDLRPPTDVSDRLWQTWLNRLGSVLLARMKRRTLTPKETTLLESKSIVIPPEPEVISTVETQDRPLENSAAIFREIGEELRTRRELLSLHLEEVERNTHVKAHYLDALERGALEELPPTVQTRGMLSNYATFLDLNVDALLLRFADALQARHRERNPQKPARKPGQPITANIPPVRSFIAGDMIFGVSIAILLVGFAIWGVSRVMTIQSQREIKPTAISISQVLLTAPAPSSLVDTPTFLPVGSFPSEATVTVEIPTQNVNAEVQLNLVAVERTYMRVVVDGKVVFEGRTVPGNAYPYEAENQIEVLVGSGAAIRIVYNGRDLGLMGTFGQVVNNIYTGTEIITPTAMATTTPTITLTPTKTAAPTSTLRSTNTPVPSATAVP